MKPFLTANWKNLIMLNYAIDPAVLQPFLPAGTELDYFNGTCYASLVGFLFLDTRIKDIAYPFHQNFEEFNLRFYVRFKNGSEWKRGVVFMKEIVPKRMICIVANTLFGEHYQYHPMRHSIHEDAASIEVKYEWYYKKQWNYINAVAENKSFLPAADSEAAFITEHYWGYAKLAANRTSEYQVIHPQWCVYPLQSYDVFCNVAALYGAAFVPWLTQNPLSAFMAEGSSVAVNQRHIFTYG